MVDGLEVRLVRVEQQALEEARLREEETRLRRDAERKLAEALAEIDRLKKGR